MTAGRQEEEKERNNVQILMSIEGHEAWSFLVLGLTIVLKIVFSSIEACFSSWLKSPLLKQRLRLQMSDINIHHLTWKNPLPAFNIPHCQLQR